ncbi:hypothetical protein VTI74DRAFT_1168 [Chaetomium olivicolor]
MGRGCISSPRYPAPRPSNLWGRTGRLTCTVQCLLTRSSLRSNSLEVQTDPAASAAAGWLVGRWQGGIGGSVAFAAGNGRDCGGIRLLEISGVSNLRRCHCLVMGGTGFSSFVRFGWVENGEPVSFKEDSVGHWSVYLGPPPDDTRPARARPS